MTGGGEGEKTLDVWHILIYWGGIYDACIEATWSAVIHDFIITMRLGRLDTLDPEVASHLVDGLALLNWVQERLAKKTYRADAESKTKVLKLDLLKAAADIGRKPKKPRQRSGLNIQPLAERAGYGKQTIYDLLEAEPEFKRELYAAFYASRESQSDS
jgi:hypothetical protein